MNRKLILTMAAVITLCSCSISRVNDTMNKNEKRADDISQMYKDVGRPIVSTETAQWVNRNPLKIKPKEENRDIPCNIVYATDKSVDINQFAQDITSQCRIPVRITPDVMQILSGSSSAATPTMRLASNNIPAPTLDPNGMQPLNTMGAINQVAMPSVPGMAPMISDVSYHGKLAGLLDLVTSRLGLYWKYEDNVIRIAYVDTRIFMLKTANAKFEQNSTVKSGVTTTGGDSASSGSGTSTTSGTVTTQSTEMGNDIYNDILQSVKKLQTPSILSFVGDPNLNKTTGSLIVSDTPDALARIDKYLKGENETLSKQIKLQVMVYKISSELNDNFDLKMGLVFKSLNKNYGINLSSTAASTASGLSSAGVEILDTASGRLSQFSGSNLLANVISEQTKNFETQDLSTMTSNLATTSIQIAQKSTYKRRVSLSTLSTNTSSGQLAQSIEPGEITTGTDLVVFPRYQTDDGKIQLSMLLSISSLKAMRTIDGGGSSANTASETIEGPSVDTRAIPMRVWLTPGETVIVSGFEMTTEKATKQGVGSPSNMLLGGKSEGGLVKETFVITITPTLR
ncbi:PilN family type IVB pilus formation outer membrane protein [Pectobacterium carotovorum]|uniref:PilN family type IVB pilus formation outer membrane protein n=1 Tax=Pectobacterium versatile TaxID=2488639 RepID=UPI000C7EBB88|nr:PilN family type IVB pilus formation outer membrane protein [Pectobacterium versatile]PLY35836.1 PilN family type IVB pilus formation outer membrane protein [Pectobacterium carotovorum]